MSGITIESLRLDNTMDKLLPEVASQLRSSEGVGIIGDGAEAVFAQFRDYAAKQDAIVNKAKR